MRAPERGSFPIDLIIPIRETLSQFKDLTGIPVGTFVEYVVHLVSRKNSKYEAVVIELAKIELSKSREETKRTAEIRKIVGSQSMLTRAALDVLSASMNSTDPRIRDLGVDQSKIASITSDLQEGLRRETNLQPHRAKLESIPEDKLIRLARKVRPQIADAGLPLRKSAETMRFTQGSDHRTIATLDKSDIAYIAGHNIDKELSAASLRFIVYDRDQGTGKCDVVNLELYRISFSLPTSIRRRLKRRVIDALDHDAEETRVRYVRNRDQTITSLIIEDILRTEEDA